MLKNLLRNPVILILVASVVSGGTGYLVTALVAARLGAAGYAGFAVFWSTLYLVVGSFGGVQQEVTRATSSETPLVAKPAKIRWFAGIAAAALLVLITVTGPLWGSLVFPSATVAYLVPLAIGAASYVLVAGLAGSLYGVKSWYPLAILIAIDGVLRLIGVLIVMSFSDAPTAIAWAVVIPFPLAIVIVAPFVAKRLIAGVRVDVTYRGLTWNVVRTIGGAIATASLISGFPFLLRLTSPSVPSAELGPLILALTLTRAPIVIPLLSLQSYLIVRFAEDEGRRTRRRALLLEGVVIAASIVLAVIVALVGPFVLSALFGADFAVPGSLLFVLVASSGLVAALCVSGPAALTAGRHGVYLAGWITAAVVTIAALILPLGLDPRVELALVIGPLAGLAVHQLAGRSRTVGVAETRP
jgi:O-antigen/teichoic acid export membrane protein